MAIITDSLKHLMAQAFITQLSASHNAYFFIGKSTEWRDGTATPGIGTLNLTGLSTTLSISNGTFTADMLGATVKNLATGEIRLITGISDPATATVNAPPSIPWSDLTSWSWKPASLGTIWIDDENPPLPESSLLNLNERDNDMLALKKLDLDAIENTVSFVIPRYNYEVSTTVYAPYKDDDGDLLNHPTQEDLDVAAAWNSNPLNTPYTPGSHFVLVESGSNLNVFKCLVNGGAQNISTVVPDKSQCNDSNGWVHSAADGYKWKFMYSISADQALNFLSESWVPVRTALVTDTGDSEVQQYHIQQLAVPGSIEVIDVVRSVIEVPHFGDMDLGTTLGDQTGMDLTHVQLPSGASGDDGYYAGCEIFVFSTTPRKRLITGYVGATKVATVDASWTVQPLNTDKACIAPAVTITGLMGDSGESADARAIVNGLSLISEIRMIDVGRAFQIANVIATTGTTPAVEVAELKAQISPALGHGSDAVKELGGYNVMVHSQIKNLEGSENADYTYDFITANDYRAVGIIMDVKDPAGNYPIPSPDTLKAVSTIKMTTDPASAYFINDEIIEYRDSVQTVRAKGYVVQHIKDIAQTIGYDTLAFVQDETTGFGSFAPITGGTLVGVLSGTNAAISEVEPAEIKHFSGSILYLEQRKPVNRQERQVEDIKMVLEF